VKVVTTTHLTPAEIRVLWALGRFTKVWSKRGGLSAIELAEVTKLYFSDIWAALSFLERAGYVCTVQGATVQSRFYLTEAGEALRVK